MSIFEVHGVGLYFLNRFSPPDQPLNANRRWRYWWMKRGDGPNGPPANVSDTAFVAGSRHTFTLSILHEGCRLP